jgi:cyclophilin family peptidyl-prolyl cis-trans isomerase
LTADSDALTLRRCALLAGILIAIAVLRIVFTYTVLAHTVDEPVHLGAGMEWLDHGTVTGEDAHPPLARALAAIGPYLAGARWTHTGNSMQDGLDVLGRDAHYDRMLALARLGILPLFVLACVMVFLWGNRVGGPPAGLISTFLFTTIPPVLAHAGVVTTDMAATALTAAGTYAALRWAERPDRRRTILLGLALGFGMIAKYSLVVFLPAIWGVMYLFHWPGARRTLDVVRARWRSALGVAAIACVVVWAGFRFSYGPLDFAHLSLPAPRFFDGLHMIAEHNENGHSSYILGERHHFGVWYFFPVTLAVKTPLALLALLAWALWMAWRKQVRIAAPLAYAAAILAIAMSSRINIGVRHVLPIYVSLAVIAGAGAAALLRPGARRRGTQMAVFGLLGWQVVSGALAHPDYLSYTNEITRGHPENFVAESDLDWGQDMHRVGDFLKRAGATEVSFTPYNVTYLTAGHAFPKDTFSDWYHPAPGWNVVSLGGWKVFNHPGWAGDRRPQFRIGRTHWAWYFAPAGEQAGVPVLIETELGTIEAEIATGKAPVSAANFLKYVDAGLYDNARFHRTVKPDNQPNNEIKIEVVQAGTARGTKQFPPIPLERTSATGLTHVDGTLSMARNGPDTATSDFSICVGDQHALDFGGKRNPDGQGFAVFGRVTKGMDIVRKIQAAPADGQRLTPPIRILRIVRKPA